MQSISAVPRKSGLATVLFRAGAYNAIDKRRAKKKWSGHVRLIRTEVVTVLLEYFT